MFAVFRKDKEKPSHKLDPRKKDTEAKVCVQQATYAAQDEITAQ